MINEPKIVEIKEIIEETPLNHAEDGIYYATPNLIHGVLTAGQTSITLAYATESAPAFLINAYCVYQGEKIEVNQSITTRMITFSIPTALANDVDIYLITRHYGSVEDIIDATGLSF